MAKKKKNTDPNAPIFANSRKGSWLLVSLDDSVYFTPTVYEHTMEPILAKMPQFCPQCKMSLVSRAIPDTYDKEQIWGRATHFNDVRLVKTNWLGKPVTYGCPNKTCQHWWEGDNPF